MRHSLKYRIHEWAADRFSWVQYPDIRPQSANARNHRLLRFVHQMPLGKRLDILLFGVGLLLVSIIVMLAVGVLIWALL